MKGYWSWGNFAAVAVLCAGSFGLSEWRGGYSSSFLFYGTAILLGVAFVSLRFGLRRVQAERHLPQNRYFAGDDAGVVVTVRRSGPIPSGWMIVTDVWTDGLTEYRHSRLLFPGFRTVLRFRYRLNKLARGKYRFLRLEVDAGDWIGLLRKRIVVPAEAGFSVYPKPLTLLIQARGPSADSGQTAMSARFETRSTPIVAAIRDYAAGDPLQRVHWKATARTGALKTKVTDPYENERLAVVLDGSRTGFTGPDGDALFEAGVRAAAGLLEWTVRQGACACLHAGGAAAQSLPFARRHSLVEAYELLSEVRADGDVPGADVLLRESAGWPGDCTVVFVTARLDEALVRTARLMRSVRRPLTVWLVQNETPLAEPQRQWLNELEAFGCRCAVIRSPRMLTYEPGGAEDVIA